MTLRFLLVVELLLVLAGGLAMQAYGASCAQAQKIRTIYWNDRNTGHPSAAADVKSHNPWAFGGSCGSWDMHNYGDYDHDHHWRDSDWWMGHDHGWVQQHHPDWFKQSEHHDNGHGPEYGHGPEHNQVPEHNQAPEHNQGHGHENY
jgi:hypothetical protein